MITPEDEKRYNLPPLPDVLWCGREEAQRLNERYERSRRRHLAKHPSVEITGPFEITPELEQERADRIDNQWKKRPR